MVFTVPESGGLVTGLTTPSSVTPRPEWGGVAGCGQKWGFARLTRSASYLAARAGPPVSALEVRNVDVRLGIASVGR